MQFRAAPYVLAAGESRRQDALLPFKACAADTGGLLSAYELMLDPWESGPVLHLHTATDEALYVLAGSVEAQLGEERVTAGAGGFVWMPRGIAHAFANAGPDPLVVLALAVPGGLEELLAEQVWYLSSVPDDPDPKVLDEIADRYGAPTLGPPIRARDAPPP
ncbi:MAG TPA: cupin domain-containing protein [Actinomycetes bacterium]|nr:cupin domain-containing protein [Actinomycetes bacterium]